MDNGNEIKVSVLVPVYNVEQWLPRCLDSILGQTLRDIEVVCVDDASPDNSAAILAHYAARDPRVRIITKTANEGLMMARKTGYTNARGQYFFFCDSDDYLPPDALESLYHAAKTENLDIAVGEMYLENNSRRHVLRPRARVACSDGTAYLRAILNWTTCSLCGSLFSRRLFETHIYKTRMHQSFSEDRLLLTQLLVTARPTIGTVTAKTYFYCLNNASITRKKLTDEALREQLNALFSCYAYIAENRPDIDADNRNFIIRYLSLYLEKGAPQSLIIAAHPDAAKLLDFNEIRDVTSLRFAAHTKMCQHSAFYRACCHTARGIIRKIQGKD